MKKEGEVMIDHRASPGIPADMAEKFGFHPDQVKEGALFEAATMTCWHCGRVVIRNPLRERARPHCYQCNQYICDICDGVRRQPDYVHRPWKAVVDLVQSGKFTMAGTSVNPVLIPRKED
jgi:hypothetical protein